MTDLDDAVRDEIVVPRSPVEWRTAGRVADIGEVRYKDRVIESIVVPYDVEEFVPWPPTTRDRLIRETVAPGTFDGVERRAGAVRSNRDHDKTRTVGRAVELHPSRSEGLVGVVRVSRTPLGDETLELAADGTLDVSVGMAPMSDGQMWTENRTRRVITRAFLDHIAFTSDPAYSGAQILDVRTGSGLSVVAYEPVADQFADEARARMAEQLARYEQTRAGLPLADT